MPLRSASLSTGPHIIPIVILENAVNFFCMKFVIASNFCVVLFALSTRNKARIEGWDTPCCFLHSHCVCHDGVSQLLKFFTLFLVKNSSLVLC